MAFYGPDLAAVHDAGHGELARAAAGALLDRLRAAGVREGLVVDLGCGSGILAAALLEAGFDVLGVDLSADLLALARRRAPGARFVQASLHDADLPPCVAVTAVGEVLSYAADPRAGRAAVAALLRRVRAALAPAGILLIDIVTPGREPPGGRRSFGEGAGWLTCVEATESGRELRRRIVTFTADGGGWRRSDELHVQVLFEPAEMLEELAAAGFRARAIEGYGTDVRFGRGHAGFEAIPAP